MGMENEKILTITRGEEFKLTVKDEIEKTDIFYDQYVNAAKILEDIVSLGNDECEKWDETESENNIIAFCGERGEGKSSAMVSFVNAVYKYDGKDENSIFSDCENVKGTYFAEPIVIDPSMFDDVHNVLDIVLATLYRKFYKLYESDNDIEKYEREKLLSQFQKVYRCVSLINDQTKMLDDEYDSEGNISKLSKLGESTNLRNEFKELVQYYLDVISNSKKEGKKNKSLVIAIDDLDLCCSSAYKMAEQIRKYLIIPNVVIVMAVKIEQLKLCVTEKNLDNYKNIYIKMQDAEPLDEVNNMAERYVAKLIPRARRIYMPNIQRIGNVRILYKKSKDGKDGIIYEDELNASITNIMLNLIYEKTGMKFLADKSGESFLMPNNLRDMVNLFVLLRGMKEPKDNDTYYDNIQSFCIYYEREWSASNLGLAKSREIQGHVMENYSQLHYETIYALQKYFNLIEKKYLVSGINYVAETNFTSGANFAAETYASFWNVMRGFELFEANVYGNTERKYAYAFRILYTIRLNELLRAEKNSQIIKFLGGYVWAGYFENVVPNAQSTIMQGVFTRSRFSLPTVRAYNAIADEFYKNDKTGIRLADYTGGEYYVSKIIEEGDKRRKKIMVWIILGMLSNTYIYNQAGQLVYTYERASVIFANYALLQYLHISLENYLVSLCDLKSLYQKVNMEMLGVSEQEFSGLVGEMIEDNKAVIEVVRKIVTNIDVAMALKESWCNAKGIKDSGQKDDLERTENVVDIFFRTVGRFAADHLAADRSIEFNSLIVRYGEKKEKINISQLYALLVQEGMNQYAHGNTYESAKKVDEVRSFAARLRERGSSDILVGAVSKYLVNKSAENAKKNMDSLALNIQRYYSRNKEEVLEENEINELCALYGKIMDEYLKNPKAEISDRLCKEYKYIVNKYKNTCI